MATQGPTTTMAGATPAGMTSRLAQMQMRFQQRQQQERDQRKVEMISTTKATATTAAATSHQHNGSSSTIRSSTISAYSATTTTTTSAAAATNGDLSASLGAGKVRQMFDERRHRVAGIDKSYPLQPIQQQQPQQAGRTVANNGSGGGSNVSNGNSAKGTTGLNNKTRVPPISANTKARLAMQQQRQQEQNGNHAETFKAASFDDNENLLDDEKFPDTISFDDDLTLTPTPIARKLPNVGKLNGQQQNVNSLKLKPVPGRTPATTSSSTVKPNTSSSSATKSVPKKTPTVASSSSAPPAAPQSSSSPSSAKSSASRASTGKSTAAVASRKPSAASSVISAASSAGTNRSVLDEPVPDGLARCTICTRNFAEDRIAKHREICQKTKSKKRKVFDTTKHRVTGTDAEKYVLQKKKVGAGASKKSISGASSTKAAAAGGGATKSDWRRKHEEFIQAIRAAKEMQAHLAKGGKLSDLPPPPPSENPDYVQCPHCSRRFNQTAAERHIPKCATMLHNKPKPTAKARRF